MGQTAGAAGALIGSRGAWTLRAFEQPQGALIASVAVAVLFVVYLLWGTSQRSVEVSRP